MVKTSRGDLLGKFANERFCRKRSVSASFKAEQLLNYRAQNDPASDTEGFSMQTETFSGAGARSRAQAARDGLSSPRAHSNSGWSNRLSHSMSTHATI